MTQSELKAFMEKENPTNHDIMTVLGELTLLVSKHAKNITSEIQEIKKEINGLDKRIQAIEAVTSDWTFHPIIAEPPGERYSDTSSNPHHLD